jgi:hypothetical protein
MKKTVLAAAIAVALSATSAFAADLAKMPLKAPPPPPSPWDIAFGGALMTDYIFRGVTQSAHNPSVAAYFEPRYNINPNLQLYAGISGESIDFPNHAAAEIDFYGGVRPTFGALALDFGFWYYDYPGGKCFNAGTPLVPVCLSSIGIPLNGNPIKADLSFWEIYAKATYTVGDWALGGNFYYTDSFLNSGADGEYASVTLKWTSPSSMVLPWGLGMYISGEFGHQWLGTSDAFYGVTPTVLFPAVPATYVRGIPYADYSTWNIGIGFTKSVFTLDLRYYDTDLSKANCNAFTSDFTASPIGTFANANAINPGGIGSNWCDSRFVAKASFDLTAMTNLK